MRKPLIAGNWKMHGSRSEVKALLEAIKAGANSVGRAELAVFPPFVFLAETQALLTGTPIAWGAQNLYHKSSGAFTGEVSPGMLIEFGCQYVILGHSERRTLFGETSAEVAVKYQAALAAGLSPIVCIGETLQQREAGHTDSVLWEQLEPILTRGENIADLAKAVIAYEPVWAIGTGLTAAPEVAESVHEKVRSWIAELDKKVADTVRILYGGSVKRDSAPALFAMPNIDGALVGGASLNAAEFLDIAQSCSNS